MSILNDSCVVVGIDEAGYGPLLGPLVVSAVVFRVPSSMLEADWWTALDVAVARKPKARLSKLVVADSKELSRRDDGLKWLERGVLSFLASPDGQGNKRIYPPTLRGLVGQVNPEALTAMTEYPWYADAECSLPATTTQDDILVQRSALGSALAEAGIEFLGAHSEILPEGHFNLRMDTLRNKSVLLLGQTLRLIQRASDNAGQSGLRVFVDKQGGRQNYGRPLMTAFEDAQLQILEETDKSSIYRLQRPSVTWTISFSQGGESRYLPIALASMFSKYIREMFMELFNAYWRRYNPELKPTAGYYEDGQRFLCDIAPLLSDMKIDRHMLVRNK